MQFFICSSYLLVINNDIGYDIIVHGKNITKSVIDISRPN